MALLAVPSAAQTPPPTPAAVVTGLSPSTGESGATVVIAGGIDLSQVADRHGVMFLVHEIRVKYHQPARLNELLASDTVPTVFAGDFNARPDTRVSTTLCAISGTVSSRPSSAEMPVRSA